MKVLKEWLADLNDLIDLKVDASNEGTPNGEDDDEGESPGCPLDQEALEQ